jgi:RNA polymerase sigma-70 factor (ECF subfamily)
MRDPARNVLPFSENPEKGGPGSRPSGDKVDDKDPRDEAAVAADLVRRIAEGDVTAEEELFERYRRGLLRLLRHLGAQPDLAEDLLQHTFYTALQRLRSEGLEEPERLAGFLCRTARYLYFNDRRKTTRRQTWSDSGELAQAVAPSPSPLDSILRDELAAKVRRLIAELPIERDRQILRRFYLLGEPKERICADLGLDSLDFNRVLSRARKRFKDLFES